MKTIDFTDGELCDLLIALGENIEEQKTGAELCNDNERVESYYEKRVVKVQNLIDKVNKVFLGENK